MKARDSWILVLGAIVLGVAILFPGIVRDIPQWGWAIFGVGFVVACLVGMWREGQLAIFAKRAGIALLLFIPFITLISVLPGEPQRDLSLPLVIGLIIVPLALLLAIALRTGFFEGIKQMFAKHPAGCQQCFSLRKDLVWFELPADTTGGSERRSLCPDCVWTEMETRLAGLSNRLLIAEPVRNANGYYSLNADGIKEWWASEGDRAEKEATTRRVFAAVEQMVDQVSGQCEECGSREANICWVPAEAFRSKWDRFSDLLGHKPDKLLSIASRRFLCGGCTGRTAREAAQATRLRLYLVTPPASDTLVMLPGEA